MRQAQKAGELSVNQRNAPLSGLAVRHTFVPAA